MPKEVQEVDTNHQLTAFSRVLSLSSPRKYRVGKVFKYQARNIYLPIFQVAVGLFLTNRSVDKGGKISQMNLISYPSS